MSESRRLLQSIGVFLIILVVAILLLATKVLAWSLAIPVVLVAFGVWMLWLAATRSRDHPKYERSPFSTLTLGIILIVLGGAWYLFTINWLYSLALILLALGAIAIAASMKKLPR